MTAAAHEFLLQIEKEILFCFVRVIWSVVLAVRYEEKI